MTPPKHGLIINCDTCMRRNVSHRNPQCGSYGAISQAPFLGIEDSRKLGCVPVTCGSDVNCCQQGESRIMRGRRLSERKQAVAQGFAPAPPGFSALMPL